MFKIITNKGYVISQASNNHIMIRKDKKLVFHTIVNRKLSNEEMEKEIEWFIQIQNLLFDENKKITDDK